MSHPYHDEPLPPRSTPAVSAIGVALLAALVVRFGLVGDALLEGWFGFAPDQLPSSLWTLLSYPFAGGRPLAIAIDLLALWLFGPRVEAAMGTRRFLLFCVLCVLGGAIAFALLGGGAPLVGPTGIALGVMLAHAWRWRHEE